MREFKDEKEEYEYLLKKNQEITEKLEKIKKRNEVIYKSMRGRLEN